MASTIFGVDHRYLALGAFGVSSGIAIYYAWKASQATHYKKTNVYESKKLLNEYLVFHYGTTQEILPHQFGPIDSLDFPKRCAELCISHCTDSKSKMMRALDIGCAVGRSSFELCKQFEKVVGIDFSQSFIDACNTLKQDGRMNYWILNEGHLTSDLTAVIDPEIDRSRTFFQQGDACNLPKSFGQFDCVLAANLICRLPDPFKFFQRLPSLVAHGGILVITSPYSIMEEFTPKAKWFGGYRDSSGQVVTGFMTLQQCLGYDFDLIEQRDMPFFIRETSRKNQWTVAHATVWKRK